MLKQRARFISTGLRLLDLVVLAIAFPIAYLVRDRVLGLENGGLYPLSSYWPLLAASFLGWQFASWMSDLYGPYRTQSIMSELVRIARALVLLAIIIAAGQFIWKQRDLSRLFFGLYYGTSFTLIAFSHIAFRLSARASRRRGFNTRNYAIVGAGGMGPDLVESIQARPEWGYHFAGYILDGTSSPPPEAHVIGKLSDMRTLLENEVLDEVIFGVRRDQLEGIEEAVLLCEEQGVNVKVLLDFFPARIARMEVEDIDGIPMLSFSSTPSEIAPLLGKRLFDIAVSAVALLLLSPVFLAVAVAIKLESQGPVFFRQKRVGLNGREFWLYKFRSMCQDAEAKLAALKSKNEMDGPVFKMRQDPRITKVGRFLRKTSLDEFPQFLNVIKGEMSVVGPRPPLPAEVRLYKSWQRRRLSVKPGITCTWQVSGRNEIDFAQWMRLDLHYIDNWSLWHDVKIVAMTIPAVLFGKGAR